MTFRRTTCPHCRAKLETGQRIHISCIDGYAEAQAEKAKRADSRAINAGNVNALAGFELSPAVGAQHFTECHRNAPIH